MENRRPVSRRVRKRITDALFALMKEKSIGAISITQIIERAGVARASFYRNYTSKESVLTDLMDEVLESFREEMDSSGTTFYTYENVALSFCYFERYGQYLCDLYDFGYGSVLQQKLDRFHEEAAGTMPQRSIERYDLYVYTGALLNTAVRWLKEGQTVEREAICRFFWNRIGRHMAQQASETDTKEKEDE